MTTRDVISVSAFFLPMQQKCVSYLVAFNFEVRHDVVVLL